MEFPRELFDTLVFIWRSAAAAHAGAHRLSQGETYAVSKKIRELSRGFTGDRALAGERYLSDPDLLGAYLLHFWPISYMQTLLCISMLKKAAGRAGVDAAPNLGRVLDLGAGPGPVSLALLDSGAARVTACDRSAAALSLARRIAGERGYDLSTRRWDALKTQELPPGPFDLIALGHTLNELWAGHPDRISLRAGLVQRAADWLAPGGRVLIIEPALKSTAQEAIRVRDALMEAGMTVEAPCIWQYACPALPDGTCHGEFAWNPPSAMVRLSHAARIGRETLKTAWFVLKRKGDSPALPSEQFPPSADGGKYRVVSEPFLSKSGRVRYLVCGPLGRFPLSAPKDARGPGISAFFRLARGDGIRFIGSKRRETGWGLDDDASLEVVERVPGGAVRPRHLV
jgi:SAM-dependent methyltransferase